MILLIDNYDSFSYNVYQLVGDINPDIKVIRNDEMAAEDIAGLAPDHIIISPGPGKPRDAGICEDVIRMYSGKVPILGICLGHQAICEAFGGDIVHARRLMHGKQSSVLLDTSCPLFKDMEPEMVAGRYHSLVADPATLPDCLKVVARTKDGELMAVQHVRHRTYGVQFHPESVLTPEGAQVLRNFLAL
ncbi:MAG: aminodeoxychorismate/anthranilate synthase component II [Clostridia bacterium]|nr:aminodeoxychorismate/anthranilate synthase component II [Clostridia bacterium]